MKIKTVHHSSLIVLIPMPDVEDPPPTEASPLVTPARNGGANPSPVSTAASSVGGASVGGASAGGAIGSGGAAANDLRGDQSPRALATSPRTIHVEATASTRLSFRRRRGRRDGGRGA